MLTPGLAYTTPSLEEPAAQINVSHQPRGRDGRVLTAQDDDDLARLAAVATSSSTIAQESIGNWAMLETHGPGGEIGQPQIDPL